MNLHVSLGLLIIWFLIGLVASLSGWEKDFWPSVAVGFLVATVIMAIVLTLVLALSLLGS